MTARDERDARGGPLRFTGEQADPEVGLDGVGNRLGAVETVGLGAPRKTAYAYDDLYRLTDVTYPETDTAHYEYDSLGNRLLLMPSAGVATSYIYNEADEMTRVCDGATCTPSTAGDYYGYEKDGTLAYFGPNADESDLSDVQAAAGLENSFLLRDYEGRYLRTGHCYDQWTGTPAAPDGAISMGDIQRVVAVFGSWEGQALYDAWADTDAASGPDGVIGIGDINRVVVQFGQACPDTGHYGYNGDGLRVEKWAGTDPITKTKYVWDVGSTLPTVLEETADGQTTYYIYGLDLIATIEGTPAAATFYQYDGLGSTTGLTNGSGTPVKTYAYDVFGAVRSTGIDQADTDFRFTGEQEDADVSGLYYLRARYYDPALGRFWSQDPWGGSASSPQTLNAYPYVGSNPANLVDPAGLCHRGTGHGPTIMDTVKTIFSLGMRQPPKRNCTGDGLAGEPIVAEGEEIAERVPKLCPDKGYVDYNFTAGRGVVGTVGAQCSQDAGWHPYAGGGVGAGAAVSVTYGPEQSITEGVFCGAQASAGYRGVGVTAQLGVGGIFDRLRSGQWPAPFFELGGFGSPGGTTGSVLAFTCALMY